MVSEIDERIFVEQPGCQMNIQGDRITTKNGQIVSQEFLYIIFIILTGKLNFSGKIF